MKGTFRSKTIGRAVALILTVVLMTLLAACQPSTPPGGSGETDGTPQSTDGAGTTQPAESGPNTGEASKLTVMTHDSFSVSGEVIDAFEKENNVDVVFIKGGDAGSALNRLILTSLTGDRPEADVFYGVDNTFLSRALENNLFEPYRPAALEQIPAALILDPDANAVPIDYGDVCINYDKAWFQENNLPLPTSLEDLTKPMYKGLLVVENPATSSPGLSFLLATIAELQEDGARDFWRALKQNGVVVASDWETAYYTHFSGSSGKGAQPMVVSYATSPAAEQIYADPPRDDSPTASLTEKGMVWRQIEFAGILRNTPNRAMAEKFIDFLLSRPFQEDVPLQMFVLPVLPDAALPPAFEGLMTAGDTYKAIDPADIALNRDRWIDDWTSWMSE